MSLLNVMGWLRGQFMNSPRFMVVLLSRLTRLIRSGCVDFETNFRSFLWVENSLLGRLHFCSHSSGTDRYHQLLAQVFDVIPVGHNDQFAELAVSLGRMDRGSWTKLQVLWTLDEGYKIVNFILCTINFDLDTLHQTLSNLWSSWTAFQYI